MVPHRQIATPKLFKTQVLVPLFKDNNLLIGYSAAEESFLNVGPTANRLETICAVNTVRAKSRRADVKVAAIVLVFIKHCMLANASSLSELASLTGYDY